MNSEFPAPTSTQSHADEFLRDIWYFALPSADLAPGKIKSRLLLGEPVLFARDQHGIAFALRDICPHRGIPLSEGQMIGSEVECCYHGWRFDAAGQCTCIPSLLEDQDTDISRISVRAYPVQEHAGCIWIYMAAPGSRGAEPVVAPPALPEVAAVPAMVESLEFPCYVDHAVIGLMDPAHGPFVHKSWWWRSRGSIHAKEKRFGPSDLGFTMLRHAPSSNSATYKLLGGEMTTEISFRLPGIRVEHVVAGTKQYCGLTAVTPIDAQRTLVTHLTYWNWGVLTVLKPLLRPFIRRFLDQDRDVVRRQQIGLHHQPSLMLINDADMQAKWYFRLKKAYGESRRGGAAFENPVKETTLRWRS
jgi:phenylpropionate dioxygenase-like ring-hydroxylating dioxygenase large terminal subunit